MRFLLLSEPDKNVKENAYLQIAWKVSLLLLQVDVAVQKK